ncbi:response regulator [Leptolyngbya sp. FACHB-17]|uniref:response regulator n=1 Tax=unclassified Leptolyngbya TaxID=2650499 RepID=UPI00168183ED|nr:response regulator [Leptolyngbya sp. FACHB-17]MBD2079269.1 response regulator [Leptolyngbya sp. FACHB-17]
MISDIALPYEDGYVLIQQVRRFEVSHRESQGSPVGVQIPVIALSAYADEESGQKAFAVGFQAYLAKPVTPNVLIRTIVQLIKNSGQ